MADKVVTRFKQPKPTYFFRQWRKHRHLTQEVLAERVGVSASSISQLETGKQGFRDSTLVALAEALNCEPGDLLSRNPLDKSAPWSILDSLMKASPEKRQEIARVVNAMLDRDLAA